MFTLDARLTALSSPDLLAALERTAAHGREVTADLIALLAECDARQLYAVEGYASLFEFCVVRLRLSEAQAYHRIQAARAARCFPLVLERLREGRLSLTAVALLREHLTEANHREILEWAEGRRKREVEAFIRQLAPKPDVQPSIRRLSQLRGVPPVAVASKHAAGATALDSPSAETSPVTMASLPLISAPSTGAAAAERAHAPLLASAPPIAPADTARPGTGHPLAAAPSPRPGIRPLAPARYSLHVTISQETHDKLRRAQDLLRHALPTADPALILDRALTLLLAQLERRKAGAPPKPRRVPAASRTAPATLATEAAGPARVQDPEALGAPRSHCTDSPTGSDAPVQARTAGAAAPRLREGDEATRRPQRSRYIPAAVRRRVWDRDDGRCGYISPSGVRCSATARLEFHHRIPFAEGGTSTLDNVMLTCSRHNAVEARRWFNFDQAKFGVEESGSTRSRL